MANESVPEALYSAGDYMRAELFSFLRIQRGGVVRTTHWPSFDMKQNVSSRL